MSNLSILLLFTNMCLIIILIWQDRSVQQSVQTNPAYQRARGFAYGATISMFAMAVVIATIDNWTSPIIGLNTIDPAFAFVTYNIALFLWLLWGVFVLLTFGTWVFAFMQCGGRTYSYYEQEGSSNADGW